MSGIYEVLGLIPNATENQVWCMLAIPAPGRQRQEYQKFRAILGYTAKLEASLGHMRLFQNRKYNKKNRCDHECTQTFHAVWQGP